MKKPRRSTLWKIDREELVAVAKSSPSMNAILRHFGLHGGAFYTLKERLEAEGFDLSVFHRVQKCVKAKVTFEPRPLVDYMTEESTYARGMLKRRLIKENIIPYVCKLCGQKPIWNGKPMVLVLDHINGIRNDHREENLRFLCPNCNSQTDTFTGRNQKRGTFCSCGNKINAKSSRCMECNAITARKVKRPTAGELQELLWKKPMVKIAKQFGVSDVTINKWAEDDGLSKPPRGFWLKENKEIATEC